MFCSSRLLYSHVYTHAHAFSKGKFRVQSLYHHRVDHWFFFVGVTIGDETLPNKTKQKWWKLRELNCYLMFDMNWKVVFLFIFLYQPFSKSFFFFGLVCMYFWLFLLLLWSCQSWLSLNIRFFFLFDHYIWSARHCSTWWSSMNDQNQLKKELFNSDIFLSRKSMFFFSRCFFCYSINIEFIPLSMFDLNFFPQCICFWICIYLYSKKVCCCFLILMITMTLNNNSLIQSIDWLID